MSYRIVMNCFFIEGNQKINSKIIHIADKSKPDFSGLVEDGIITVKRFISFIQSWDKDAYGEFYGVPKDSRLI